jgi:hypothetical protein
VGRLGELRPVVELESEERQRACAGTGFARSRTKSIDPVPACASIAASVNCASSGSRRSTAAGANLGFSMRRNAFHSGGSISTSAFSYGASGMLTPPKRTPSSAVRWRDENLASSRIDAASSSYPVITQNPSWLSEYATGQRVRSSAVIAPACAAYSGEVWSNSTTVRSVVPSTEDLRSGSAG